MNVTRYVEDAIARGDDALELEYQGVTELPAGIKRFAGRTLDLSGNRVRALPALFGGLSNLTGLYLRGNSGVQLPAEIGEPSSLKFLDLAKTGLTAMPPSLFKLTQLVDLDLAGNGLSTLPPEVGRLRNLERLCLSDNQLTALPPEIGLLDQLLDLDLSDNQLTTLPPTIGHLPQSTRINLKGNPFTELPPELRTRGSDAILAYFRAALVGERPWLSKLLVVGQGGVGKTCLLQSLRADPHRDRSTTQGVEIGDLELPHPTEPGVTMHLKTWDFGGQEIYHATHQFFLTNRSLFLVVWNARHEWEQGKLTYWLDTIRALAPDSPILLVATFRDQRDARLPLNEIKRKYPKVVGNWSVSNTERSGFDDLRAALAGAAAGLPLMAELWPSTWLAAARVIRALPAGHVRPEVLYSLMREHGVGEEGCDILAGWLHELGDILFFTDSQELDGIVILRPEWVTREISKVLESDEVEREKGALSRDHAWKLWNNQKKPMREHLLRLMERFDLSYRTLADPNVSLVVERLPLDSPDYMALWDAPKTLSGCKELEIRYKLNTIPAGVPTWFVAREHRWTTITHWRFGAVFAQELRNPHRIALGGDPTTAEYADAFAAARDGHLALIQADAQERSVRLTVRGPMPANFFLLLKDGMEVILDRFPGLGVERLVPCPGHDGLPCTGEWELKKLDNAVRKNAEFVPCPETFLPVRLEKLLYGIDGQTTLGILLAKMQQIDAKQDRSLAQQDTAIGMLHGIQHTLNDLELKQREFTGQFRAIQEQIDLRCPNVFVLYHDYQEGPWHRMRRTIAGDQLVLHLCCQHPTKWHPVVKGGRYVLSESAEWLKTMAPYVRQMVQVMKYATPLIGPIAGVFSSDMADLFKDQIKLMEELVKDLPDITDDEDVARAEGLGDSRGRITAHGARLRLLRKLLESLDPNKEWGGLERVVTKEGHNLWLCEHHKAEYRDG